MFRGFCKSKIGFCIGDPYHILRPGGYAHVDAETVWRAYQEWPNNICIDSYSGSVILSAATLSRDPDGEYIVAIYTDNAGRVYETESDCISLVPLEVYDGHYPDIAADKCQIFELPGEALFIENNGFITIKLPSGVDVQIDTSKYKEG